MTKRDQRGATGTPNLQKSWEKGMPKTMPKFEVEKYKEMRDCKSIGLARERSEPESGQLMRGKGA